MLLTEAGHVENVGRQSCTQMGDKPQVGSCMVATRADTPESNLGSRPTCRGMHEEQWQPFWHVAKNNPKIRRHRGNIIGSQMCPATDLFGDVRFQIIFGESQASHNVFGAPARYIWESYFRHQVKNLILG